MRSSSAFQLQQSDAGYLILHKRKVTICTDNHIFRSTRPRRPPGLTGSRNAGLAILIDALPLHGARIIDAHHQTRPHRRRARKSAGAWIEKDRLFTTAPTQVFAGQSAAVLETSTTRQNEAVVDANRANTPTLVVDGRA